MGIDYAQPGDIVNARPLGAKIGKAKTKTLLKTDEFEVVRLVIHAGREIAAHLAPGELVLQCLEGEVEFTALGKKQKVRPGDLLYLPARVPHSLMATADSSLLLTILYTLEE
ncbi:MAG: cupin domain-containing protein [Planctomycetales bacterium]